MIPKIIHQIYWDFTHSGKKIPKEWARHHKNIKKLHQDWTIKLWDFNETCMFLKSYLEHDIFNQFLELPDILKIDFARIAILKKYGGFYLDMDIHLENSLDCLINEQISTIIFSIGYDDNNVIQCCNAALAASPDSPIISNIWQKILAKLSYTVKTKYSDKLKDEWVWFVKYAFGPKFITNVLIELYGKDVRYIPSSYFSFSTTDCNVKINWETKENIMFMPPEALLGYKNNEKGYIFGYHLSQKAWNGFHLKNFVDKQNIQSIDKQYFMY